MKKTQEGFIGVALLIILALAVILGGGYYLMTKMQETAGTSAVSQLPSLQMQTETNPGFTEVFNGNGTTTTYTSHQFSFNITYPATLEATTSSDSGSGFTHGTVVMALDNVTAGGATRGTITVGASASADDVTNCMAEPQLDTGEDGPVAAGHKTINGVDFVYRDLDSPAAGQFETDEIYRTLRGTTCFEIDESYFGIESGHLQGQDAINNDADIKQVSNELDAIAQSFQFISSTNPAPSCTLSTDKQSYAVGDTITLSWTSQNAVLAIWEQPTNSYQPNTIIPPAQQPGTSGTATAIASIAGDQTIALDMAGHGGIASCQAQVSITPSTAHTTISVNSLQEMPNTTGKAPYASTIIQMSGTIQNASLLNSSGINIVFINSNYNGPTDYQDLDWHVNVNDLDNHPLDAGEQGSVPITSNASTWNAQFYNYMPPGSYNYYIFPDYGTASSTDILASGTFNSISWSNNPNVTVIYPRSGSDFFTENGGQTKIYWTVPQSVVSSFPSDFNLYIAMNAVWQGNPGSTAVGVGEFNFTDGSAIWDVDSEIKNGLLTPGYYEIYWNLVAKPQNASSSCTQTGTAVTCEPPSAADQAVMEQAENIHGVTGWFSVDK